MITQGQIQDAKTKLNGVATSLASQGMSADEAMVEARRRLPEEAQLEAAESTLFPEPPPPTEETPIAEEAEAPHHKATKPHAKHK